MVRKIMYLIGFVCIVSLLSACSTGNKYYKVTNKQYKKALSQNKHKTKLCQLYKF